MEHSSIYLIQGLLFFILANQLQDNGNTRLSNVMLGLGTFHLALCALIAGFQLLT